MTITAEIRKIIRKAGLSIPTANLMWTNKYAKTRTVKCYITDKDKAVVDTIINDVADLCEARGITEYGFARLSGRGWNGRGGLTSFIITVPRDDV